jgi:tetraacyldisaccharide 4'-kinase
MREPAFWQRRGAAAALLSPAAAVYGAIAAWRLAQPGWRAAVPVLCVGNFTLGGAGKTPAAIAIARLAAAAGHRPFFLSRGYGGRLAGPSQVSGHSAREVGDEALLLARTAPTVVARHRPAGAKTAAAAGASLIIMDDGLQNPSLAKNVSLALVDDASL